MCQCKYIWYILALKIYFFRRCRPPNDHLSVASMAPPPCSHWFLTTNWSVHPWWHHWARARAISGGKTSVATGHSVISKCVIVSRNAHWIQFHLQPLRRSRCASFFSRASMDNVICIPELGGSEKKDVWVFWIIWYNCCWERNCWFYLIPMGLSVKMFSPIWGINREACLDVSNVTAVDQLFTDETAWLQQRGYSEQCGQHFASNN